LALGGDSGESAGLPRAVFSRWIIFSMRSFSRLLRTVFQAEMFSTQNVSAINIIIVSTFTKAVTEFATCKMRLV